MKTTWNWNRLIKIALQMTAPNWMKNAVESIRRRSTNTQSTRQYTSACVSSRRRIHSRTFQTFSLRRYYTDMKRLQTASHQSDEKKWNSLYSGTTRKKIFLVEKNSLYFVLFNTTSFVYRIDPVEFPVLPKILKRESLKTTIKRKNMPDFAHTLK